MMIARLRPLSALCLATLLAACASSPSSNLGELPHTPNASIEQLLQQAATAKPEEAVLLKLSAADLAYQQKDVGRAAQILEQIPMDSLKPAQQIFASTLDAQIALARNKPKAALKAFDHPSFTHLGELPVEQQARSGLVKAQALAADGQALAAARERVFVDPLLNAEASKANHEAIWGLVSSLPVEQLQPVANEGDLNGWMELARVVKSASTLQEQQANIAKTTGETVVGAYDAGLIGRKTALRELKQSAEVTGIFSNIDDAAIEAADDEPPEPAGEGDAPPNPIGGLNLPGAGDDVPVPGV